MTENLSEHTQMWEDEIRNMGLNPDHVKEIVAKLPPPRSENTADLPECSMGYDCDDTTHDGHCGEPTPTNTASPEDPT
jgi:hypothetical protein